MDYIILGRNIAKKRLQNGLTQEQLAEKAEVSTVFISQIETGVRKPSLETICKISSALETTIDSLLGTEMIEARFDEVLKILQNKNADELDFIVNVLKEICNNLKDGKVSPH
ncbi:MAG: helix-turn-helix transcriptional regulator [Clostridia bacterium]|nr:helix-turn-helix transcriptional regulator [Clostridia bacterium]